MPDDTDSSSKRTEVDGRAALMVFLKPDFEPGTEDDHTMVKVIYDDGDIEYLRKPE